MKKILTCLLIFWAGKINAQDLIVLQKQAINYERALKEDSAILKYKEILSVDKDNLQALIKISLLTTAKGARLSDKKAKYDICEFARSFADKALVLDSNNADANYAKGLAALKLSEVEIENKRMTAWLRESNLYATKALAINPNHGRANFLLGKWNFDIVNTAWAKKAAVKVLYGGVPEASIENAIALMEKCRIAEPYFVQNFFELGKAYKFNNNPSKAIEIFTLLVKLPNRTADDAAWKAEGKKLLNELQ